MPQNIYDDPHFFEGYSQFRRSREGLAGAPEWPTVRSMLPVMDGLRVLDLGCGFGAFDRWAHEMGAAHVLGIDLSEKMLARARAQAPDSGVTYRLGDIEQLALSDASFDLVYSALALHYIADLDAVIAVIRRLLAPGGHLVFTVEHPIYTAPSHPGWQTDAHGNQVWPINDYLIEGRRVTDWIRPGIVKYHHTVAGYVNILLGHGFSLARLEEWGPTPEQVAEHPEMAVELHRPPFLLVAAHV
ncbi:MAG: class I SAM-dependent methyltransferase [Chloroflexi bacterium]|nr:class I SAM-dependent methyltransferase [Chloroflexota bacterium]